MELIQGARDGIAFGRDRGGPSEVGQGVGVAPPAAEGKLAPATSRGAGVVLTTKTNVHLKHIEFVRLDPTRALVVLVSDDGSVENRLLDLPPGLPASALQEASNFMNARLRGRTRGAVRIGLANLAGPRSAARTAAPAIGLG